MPALAAERACPKPKVTAGDSQWEALKSLSWQPGIARYNTLVVPEQLDQCRQRLVTQPCIDAFVGEITE